MEELSPVELLLLPVLPLELVELLELPELLEEALVLVVEGSTETGENSDERELDIELINRSRGRKGRVPSGPEI